MRAPQIIVQLSHTVAFDATRGIIARMETQTATLTIDGLSVTITLDRDSEGPYVVLSGDDCNLEGEAPGLYYLTPLA